MVQVSSELSTSEELASFIDSVSYESLPSEVPPLVERCVLDTVGVIVAGLDEGAGEIALAVDRQLCGDASEAPIVGTDRRTTVPNAGLVLGTAAHGLDYDDVSPSMTGHPSATLVPPLLALSDDAGPISGREAITAFVAGYEVECYLDDVLSEAHVQQGWHSTAILGPFGAATVAAVLLDLDPDEIRHALNICVSLAAGSSANVGSMTKPLHVGHAVETGITAAYLAGSGFTGADEAFDTEHGFFQLYSGNQESGGQPRTLGEDWAIVEDGGIFKKYPSCYYTHGGIEIMEELRTEHDISPDDIERIHATVSEGANLECPKPTTGLEAKFSNHYTIACGLLYDSIELDLFRDEALPNEETEALAERIEVSVDPDLEYTSFETELEITLADGTTLQRRKTTPPGYPGNRVTEDELLAKFDDCATTGLSPTATEKLRDRLQRLSTLDDIRQIASTSE